MKTIIAGSREIKDLGIIERAVKESEFEVTSVTSGGARGVDKTGEEWASKNNLPCEVISANWDTFGKAAGYIRNEEMAQCSEALIAVWDGKSKGKKTRLMSCHSLVRVRRKNKGGYMNSKEKFNLFSVIVIASISSFKFYEIAGWYGVIVSAYVYSNVALIAFLAGVKTGNKEAVKEDANSIRRKGKQKIR
jgi:hypothetical protein